MNIQQVSTLEEAFTKFSSDAPKLLRAKLYLIHRGIYSLYGGAVQNTSYQPNWGKLWSKLSECEQSARTVNMFLERMNVEGCQAQ